jgi:hypothetical protein
LANIDVTTILYLLDIATTVYQLIYVSDKINTFVPRDVNSILSSARKNNEKHGITGLLVELPKHFIQILEGNQGRVKQTFNRISHDSRHQNVRVILGQNIEFREIEAWEMGFSAELNESQLNDALHILNTFSKKQSFTGIQGQSLKILLKSLSHK